uniref:ABC transporter domain-containing protein n=1 Tax=Oryza brachyantha TaxID=4533 RepID=J3LBW2_ORYBR
MVATDSGDGDGDAATMVTDDTGQATRGRGQEGRGAAVRYATHLPFVLKGLTCTLPERMKTGIVGRTGNGKSTLIQALFRIVDPCIGQVLIDGLHICTIGLHDLRTRLSIIPQDPVMFEGSIAMRKSGSYRKWRQLECGSEATCLFGEGGFKEKKGFGFGRSNFFSGSNN